MRSVWKWLLAAPLLTAMLVPVIGWHLEARRAVRGWSQTKARNRDKPIPVRTALVTQGDAVDVVGATCVTEPSAVAPIVIDTASEGISNRVITKIHVVEGEAVELGQPLFEFNPLLFEQTLAQAQANVKMLEEQVENTKTLVGEGAASKLEVTTAEAELETAKLALKIAQTDFDQCTIRSPIDGVVSGLSAAPGVRIADLSELVTVYQLDPILVRMDFPLERLDAVQIGKDAEVTLDSFPNENYQGKVARIAANAMAQTRVLHVYIELPNKDLRLRGGITGFSRLTTPKQAVTVPSTAVIRRKGRSMVFRVENDVARLTEVQTGAIVRDGQLELIEGLQPGDEVVVFGQDHLRDGDRVDGNWRRWANRDNAKDETEAPADDPSDAGAPAGDLESGAQAPQPEDGETGPHLVQRANSIPGQADSEQVQAGGGDPPAAPRDNLAEPR